MFTNQELLIFIFKTINFVLFIGLAIYASKKYLIPFAEQEFATYKEALKRLYTAKEQLDIQQNHIDQQRLMQQQLAQELTQKVHEWHRVVSQGKEQWDTEQEVRQLELVQRYTACQQANAQERTQRVIAKKVLDAMEHDLQTTFAQQQRGQTYLDDVLKVMRKLS